MKSSDRSILQQKASGSYDRNQYIRFLYQKEKNKAVLGRQFNLSRQAIRKILAEASDHET